ncbi:AraC family transcriptional regulator [Sphingobacterium sp. UDSM-2020]|uniref:AraC family transcriptional regulator n=1 Tax=Sphingobacterium sp. UDSM-2020 TaxID=2795738 RepID=UPI001938C1B0|nr:helix-turn-helix domain-containing protein [Sphingobacterium sp. UDSM-2020]QQD12248.1 helix-turn-helix domain-containing protein [Sphingobacterium sp. UDSM-2020]
MRKKNSSIPIKTMTDAFSSGIIIAKASFDEQDLLNLDDARRSHRDDYHSFFLLENGTTEIEIDFQQYTIPPYSILYIHPHQVHRIVAMKKVGGSFLGINSEHINPEYLQLLEEMTPLKPLRLSEEIFSILETSVSLCITLSDRKQKQLHQSLLKDSCNTLIGLLTSMYLEGAIPVDKLSRSEIITKAFKASLQRDFLAIKRPAAYAMRLNISTPYLNECVKDVTGYPVSYHIQQRIILEAKRLLYHSDKSVKEIADALGFEDYPYFSRLFSKVTGMSALSFRNKNRD